MSMTCPQCGAWTTVKETRTRKTDNVVVRRYECANEHRFTTEERLKDELLRLRLQSGPELPSKSRQGGKGRTPVSDARGTAADAVAAVRQTLSEVAADLVRRSAHHGTADVDQLRLSASAMGPAIFSTLRPTT